MNILINENVTFEYAGYFSSKEEWIHPTRKERTYEIIYVTKGDVYMSEEDNHFKLSEGMSVILSPEFTHTGTQKSKDVQFYWVHFRTKSALPFEKRIFERFENPYLFKELLHTNNLPEIPECLVNSILVHILSEYYKSSVMETFQSNAVAEKIFEWIRINASGALKVKDVSDEFGLSPDYVTRLIKKHHGTGANTLINRFVMAKARQLLCNTELYIKEIADRLGFTSDKAFISYFKYYEGCYPSAFRSRYGKLHMNNQ